MISIVVLLLAAAVPSAPPAALPEKAEGPAACPLVAGPPSGPVPISSAWHEGAPGFDQAQGEQVMARVPMLVYFFTDWVPLLQCASAAP